VFGTTTWLDGLDPFIGIPGDAPRSVSSVRGPMVDVTTVDASGLACGGALPGGSLSGKVVLILRGICTFEEKINNAQQEGATGVVVYTHTEEPDPIPMGMGTARLAAMMISNADGVRAKERLRNGSVETVLDFTEKAVPVNSSRLPDFTSKGPSVDHRIKPELIAVGTAVYTAAPGTAYMVAQGTSFSAPMVSGAAALLKAFRPGLSGEQYKSLLVNSTSLFAGSAFPLQETGAGLMDLGAAARSTLTAVPSALDFGAGGATVDSVQRLVIRNHGTAADTFSITAATSNDGTTPVVSPAIVELGPGASAEISVRLNGTNLPARAHEGFLSVRGTQTEVTTRVPYWYASTNGTAKSITVVEAPESGRAASSQVFYVRTLDVAGVPLQSEPKVTVISTGAGARVTAIESVDSRYPGFYEVRVRLSIESGENIFEIEGGSVTTRVTIIGL
jgi:subtilisin family serine protease